MLRVTGLAMLSMLVCGVGIAAADDGSLGDNAALKYWQAFATLPKLADEEQWKLINDYPTMPLGAHAKELVADAEYSLRMLHRAATVRACNWGIGYKVAKSHWRDVSYEITKINLYKVSSPFSRTFFFFTFCFV